jgi:hypothetical protein
MISGMRHCGSVALITSLLHTHIMHTVAKIYVHDAIKQLPAKYLLMCFNSRASKHVASETLRLTFKECLIVSIISLRYCTGFNNLLRLVSFIKTLMALILNRRNNMITYLLSFPFLRQWFANFIVLKLSWCV